MTERDLIGTWRRVAYGDISLEGRHLIHLRADGTAVSEGEYEGQPYSIQYTWRLTGPAEWELRRTIPPGEIPGLDEECIQVEDHVVVEFDGARMAVSKFDYEERFHFERVGGPVAGVDPAP